MVAVIALGLLVGCGESGSPGTSRSPIVESEVLVKRAAMRDVRRNADPNDWLVYSSCSSRSRCRAELRYLGLPDKALAVDHYQVNGKRAKRSGASQIQVALTADSLADCTGTYLATEDPSDLMACSAR